MPEPQQPFDEFPMPVLETLPAKLGAISRAVNEAIGRASVLDPALRELLIGIGHALDDVINDVEDFDG